MHLRWCFFCFAARLVSAVLADPCANAADPVQCHYQAGMALLAGISAQPSGPSIPGDVQPISLMQQAHADDQKVASDDQKVTSDYQKVTPSPSSVGKVLMNKDVEAKEVVALRSALEVLEAPGSPGLGWDKDVDMLEDSLESLQPGGVASFRTQHLADEINSRGPPVGRVQRAAQAFHFLEAAEWPVGSDVPHVMAHLRQVGFPKPAATSLLQTVEDTLSGWGGQFQKFLFHSQRCAKDIKQC
eukprot:gnl/MRDRNA2_/MRDRNA2_138175_c0_seq1.p1 gnl/MRDRNA2_/MRDRNA2_138175_c0~~gnl/MRDRNA2_/MRDRNA2_138175_c0_seq1.p1  ORF type:complete len:243 (+),score=49.29 gnl/MRDRNA2_/MRDRNA2_138175_c0_seq1:82-810(+)